MAYDTQKLLAMTQPQLDEIFRASPAGAIPSGHGHGTAIIAAGTFMAKPIARMVRLLAWQGKNFDPGHRILKNRITTFGIEAIPARVYKDVSLLDGKECIVIDYSSTSRLAHFVRDEIRMIGPDFYLGRAYWGKTRLLNFSLLF